MLRKLFKADYIYCTLLIFGFMLGISKLAPNLTFLNPIEQALEDFEMTDVVFGNEDLREPQLADTNIVLVNFGSQSRRRIAKQIEIIAAQHPKVLGIDCHFRTLKRPDDDSLLASALSKVKNLVLYSKMQYKAPDSKAFDTIGRCHPIFARYGTSGFTNLVTPGKETYITCRSFSPRETANGVTETAFAVEIARYVDSNMARKFLERGNDVELINFRGNYQMFYSLDVNSFIGEDDDNGFMKDPELPISLKDKVVIMGYMGDDFSSADMTRDDKFHTPMNEHYAGKSYPDMFGVVVHANIVSMILHDVPLNQMGVLTTYLLALLLCYITVIFFFYIHDEFPSWYDMVVKTSQVLIVMLILFAVIFVFAGYRYKMDLSVAAVAVGLSGDLLEVYTGAMYNIVGRFTERVKKILQGKSQVPVRADDAETEGEG